MVGVKTTDGLVKPSAFIMTDDGIDGSHALAADLLLVLAPQVRLHPELFFEPGHRGTLIAQPSRRGNPLSE